MLSCDTWEYLEIGKSDLCCQPENKRPRDLSLILPYTANKPVFI